MPFTDDPIADFHNHDRKQHEWIKQRPVCSECGHEIQEEFAFHINDEWVHVECMNTNYLKSVEDYIE